MVKGYYRDKVAFITGGSSGIGLAIACELAAEGANVAVFGRSREKLAEAFAAMAVHRQHHRQLLEGFELDVCQPGQIDTRLAPALAAFGVPDIVITSAGLAVARSFADHTLADFRNNLDTNVLGTVSVIHTLVPAMAEQGGGHLVMLGSLGGLVPTWGYSAYSTSKAALQGLADVLADELGPQGFSVSLVCPPETATPMIAAEAATIPAQTRFLKDLVGTHNVEAVARSTLDGVARGKFLVIHGVRARMAYTTKRLFPRLFRWSSQLLLNLRVTPQARG